MDWDTGSLYVSNQNLGSTISLHKLPTQRGATCSSCRKENFTHATSGLIKSLYIESHYYKFYEGAALFSELRDLNSYDEDLEESLRREPTKFVGEFEGTLGIITDLTLRAKRSYCTQLLFKSDQRAVNMRDLAASDINSCCIFGIVTWPFNDKARSIVLKCRSVDTYFQYCARTFRRRSDSSSVSKQTRGVSLEINVGGKVVLWILFCSNR